MEGFDPVGKSPLKFRWPLLSVPPLFDRRAIRLAGYPNFERTSRVIYTRT